MKTFVVITAGSYNIFVYLAKGETEAEALASLHIDAFETVKSVIEVKNSVGAGPVDDFEIPESDSEF